MLQVLRPYSNISNLRIWEYYTTENLAHGPSYDFEVIDRESKREEEEEAMEAPLGVPYRKILNGCYDDVMRVEPDAVSYLLQVFFG